MIHPDKITQGNDQFPSSVAVFGNARSCPKPQMPAISFVRSFTPNELNLSGSKVLVGCISALCMMGLLLWAILKLWLFD